MRAALISALLVALGLPVVAAADPPRKIAIGGVESLADESADDQIVGLLERGLAGFAGVELISARAVERRLRRARKPQLAACEGVVDCLAEMGRAVGSDWVVFVESSGLGDVRLIHLKLVDVSAGRALRSITAELAAGATEIARASLVELLDPDRLRGNLVLRVNAEGAAVIIDGRRLAETPAQAIELAVGTHALRITHPEFRDYLRFVDIEFEDRLELDVEMAALGVVSSELEPTGTAIAGPAGGEGRTGTPWYRRWYVIGGIGVAVLAGSIAIWAATSDELGFDSLRDLP